MKRIFFSIFLSMILILSLTAQNGRYEKGFAVTVENDTVHGLLLVENQYDSQSQLNLYTSSYTKKYFEARDLKMFKRGEETYLRNDYQPNKKSEIFPKMMLLLKEPFEVLEYIQAKKKRGPLYFLKKDGEWIDVSERSETKKIKAKRFPEWRKEYPQYAPGFIYFETGDTIACFIKDLGIVDSHLRIEARDIKGYAFPVNEGQVDAYERNGIYYRKESVSYGLSNLNHFVRECSQDKEVDLYVYNYRNVVGSNSGVSFPVGNGFTIGIGKSFHTRWYLDIGEEMYDWKPEKVLRKIKELFPNSWEFHAAFDSGRFGIDDLEAAIEIYNGRLD